MKRLLSWLLVLTMLVACLPMSVIPALAVETDVDTGSDSDLELPFDELLPTEPEFGTEENPLALVEGENEFTVIPGTIFHATYPNDGKTYIMTVTGSDSFIATQFMRNNGSGDAENPVVLTLNNEYAAAMGFGLTFESTAEVESVDLVVTLTEKVINPGEDASNPIVVSVAKAAPLSATANITAVGASVYYAVTFVDAGYVKFEATNAAFGIDYENGDTLTVAVEAGQTKTLVVGNGEWKAEAVAFTATYLTDAEIADIAAAEAVTAQINALTDLDMETWETILAEGVTAEQVAEARAAYEALSDGAKALVEDYIVNKLALAEELTKPEYVPYVVETRGYGLSLEAELIISSKFVLPAELAADENAMLKIQFIDDVTEISLVEYLKGEGHTDNKGRMVIEQSVKSFWMTHLVTVTITDGNGYAVNYVDYFGDSHEGSYQFGAENYVRTMNLAGETTINAVRALLTYGAYAQDYFAAQGKANITEERATAILTKYGYEPVDISGITEDNFAQEKTGSGDNFDGISIRGNQPTLDAAIYMKVQFNASGLKEADLGNYTYKLSYMVGNTKIEEDLVPEWDSRGRLVFYVYDIAAMLFDCMYEITITKTATGETYTGATSIISYMNDAYASFANDASFQNLLKAMYAYNQAANTHFGK